MLVRTWFNLKFLFLNSVTANSRSFSHIISYHIISYHIIYICVCMCVRKVTSIICVGTRGFLSISRSTAIFSKQYHWRGLTDANHSIVRAYNSYALFIICGYETNRICFIFILEKRKSLWLSMRSANFLSHSKQKIS